MSNTTKVTIWYETHDGLVKSVIYSGVIDNTPGVQNYLLASNQERRTLMTVDIMDAETEEKLEEIDALIEGLEEEVEGLRTRRRVVAGEVL